MKESVNDTPAFYLQPGGIKEETNVTDLPPNAYVQASGILNNGVFTKMPGKTLIRNYAPDKIFQIAQFGGATIVQHGTTIEFFADSCALVPIVAPPPVVVSTFSLDLPNSKFGMTNQMRLVGIDLEGMTSGGAAIPFYNSWTEAQFLQDTTKASLHENQVDQVADLTPADYYPLDLGPYITVGTTNNYVLKLHMFDYTRDQTGGSFQGPTSFIESFTFSFTETPDGSVTTAPIPYVPPNANGNMFTIDESCTGAIITFDGTGGLAFPEPVADAS